jgi:hypothetical protein
MVRNALDSWQSMLVLMQAGLRSLLTSPDHASSNHVEQQSSVALQADATTAKQGTTAGHKYWRDSTNKAWHGPPLKLLESYLVPMPFGKLHFCQSW